MLLCCFCSFSYEFEWCLLLCVCHFMVLCFVFSIVYLTVEGFCLCCFFLDSFCGILCWLFLVGGFVGFCFLVVVELIVEVDASCVS